MRFRMVQVVLRVATWAAGIILSLTMGAAAQDLPRWQAALGSGSPRLAAFGLMRDRPLGEERLAVRLLHGEGLIGDPRPDPALLARSATIRPLLRWDDNINGGIPGDRISLGGTDWTIDEASRAQSGIVLGATVQAALRYRLAQGRTLQVAGQASWVQSPKHGLSRLDAGLAVCMAQALGNWRFVDLCGGGARARTDLSSSRQKWVSLRGTKLFEAGGGLHEAWFGVRHSWRETYEQEFIDVGLTSALAGVGAVGVRLSLGEAVADVNALRQQVGLSLNRPLFGRPGRISVDYAREDGSKIFGMARRDRIWGLSLERQMSDAVSARIALQRRASTIGTFDENRAILEFNWLH